MSRASLSLLLALSLMLAACAGVLGLRPRASRVAFPHRAHVLEGVNCKECHTDVASSSKERPPHFPTKSDCVRCHTEPHTDRDCLGCHTDPSARGGAELAREHLRFDHAKHMPAVKGDCVRCHQEVALERPQALRPKMATCFSCHQHEKQWATRDCDGCHVDLEGERTLPSSHLVHDGDWLREHGTKAASSRDLCATCHSERSCSTCHGVGTVPGLPARLAFDEVRLNGLHRAGFRSRHSEEARAQPGLCTTCHSEQSCIECHQLQKVAPGEGVRSPHPRNWLSPSKGGGEHGNQARLDPMGCAGCHGGAGEQLCVNCHRVGGPGGSPHGAGFASNKDKFHDVPCRQCHGVGH